MNGDFVLQGDLWFADVGDGLIGPAGSDILDLGSVHLEIDRTAADPLLAVMLDEDPEDDLDSGLALLPERDAIRAGNGEGTEILLGDEFVSIAARVARITGELDSVGTSYPEERAFEVVALLELVPLLQSLEVLSPGVADPAAAASRAARLTEADEVRSELVHPFRGEERHRLLVSIVDGAAAVVPAVAAVFQPIVEILAEGPVADVFPVLLGAGSSEFRGGLTFRGDSSGSSQVSPGSRLPRSDVADARFTARPSPVLAEPATGSVDRVGPAAVRVVLHGVVRSAATADFGPLWVRLFSGSRLLGGGALESDVVARTAETVIGGVLEPGEVTHVEVWLNPYRHPSLERLEARSLIRLADEALSRGRLAARLPSTSSEPEWFETAELWLAAGYYDRAALAYALAGDDVSARMWARSDQAFRRLSQGVPNPRPDCLEWHPDVLDL